MWARANTSVTEPVMFWTSRLSWGNRRRSETAGDGSVDGRGLGHPAGGAVFELDARYLIRAEDGALIDIVNRGYWRALSPKLWSGPKQGRVWRSQRFISARHRSSVRMRRSIGGWPKPYSSASPVRKQVASVSGSTRCCEWACDWVAADLAAGISVGERVRPVCA